MTRFVELELIEAAIVRRDTAQLRWARGYCRMRLQLAQKLGSSGIRKQATSKWRRLMARIDEAQGEPDGRS